MTKHFTSQGLKFHCFISRVAVKLRLYVRNSTPEVAGSIPIILTQVSFYAKLQFSNFELF